MSRMTSGDTNHLKDQPDTSSMENSVATHSASTSGEGQSLSPRSYQKEMLEASLERNIIVAMDTGSGKSLIAVLRIQHALERCPVDQLIFVLVPSVALVTQWNTVISAQLPSVQIRPLSGADGVDRWRDQWIWDEVLKDIRVVICTHQILLDTLIHGFIRMSGLALIVFDEAHHCVASHPANRIMQDFYHPSATSRPAILGLTASPVTNNRAEALNVIEGNLNAIARTPKNARDELIKHVKKPELIRLQYPTSSPISPSSLALSSLRQHFQNLDIEQDPYVMKLRSVPAAKSSKQLTKALASHKTYCQEQLKSLHTKALDIYEELGSWATNYYVQATIQKFCAKGTNNIFSLSMFDEEEKNYLKKILRQVENPACDTILLGDGSELSPKVQCLIDYLASFETAEFTGLVFVKTRATCAVLAHLLSKHVRTKDTLRISTFVGMSANANKKFDLGELVDIKNQKDTLEHLRRGQKNLVISTSALEEGIDVSACNLVICFEKPPNLKSFIQRRGRARKSQSKYVIMFPEEGSNTTLAGWQQLEEQMRRAYMDEMRELQELKEAEELDNGRRVFRVESTGAQITLEDAVQHLYHFCSTLPADPYADLRPIFTFTETTKDVISASVCLPNSVDTAVRDARSLCNWASQKMAKRDAAFEAYVNLYKAGLISDHLLPLRVHDPALAEAESVVQKIASIVDVQEQLNIWHEVATDWESSKNMQASTISITVDGKMHLQMQILLPRKLPGAMYLTLYWDASTTLKAIVEPSANVTHSYHEASALSSLLLQSVFKGRLESDRNDYAAVFVPLETQDLQGWAKTFHGTTNACALIDKRLLGQGAGIVRDLGQNGLPHILDGTEYLQPRTTNDQLDGAAASNERDESAEPEPYLRAKGLPKRADFLHAIPSQNKERLGPGFKYLLASECEVDNLPFAYSQFALFIPSILHVVEVNLLAESLCKNVLPTLQFNDLSLVVTAISASVAREATNYQRLEFLGDSILKYFTSLTLLTTHLNWHEGYLSHQKDHIVSNANLARHALAASLDKYILTKPFTGLKWRPHYVSSLLTPQSPRNRQLSTKTLADVVESLIGAAYLDGGFSKALECMQVLLPSTPWKPISDLNSSLYVTYTSLNPLPDQYTPLQSLLHHTFNAPALLLEALTHPSHLSSNSTSYQRLEFLGDALLDRIITTTAFSHMPEIETHTLHLIRTALVNANFLAFLCMNFFTTVTRKEIDPPRASNGGNFATSQDQQKLPLWAFMLHSSPTVAAAQAACQKRFERLRPHILSALESGIKYPWTLLAQLDAPKFFSDIIESVLGAIYIDSKGSWEACEGFLKRLGMMSYPERILNREGSEVVRVWHPKEELGVVAVDLKVKYDVFRVGEKERGGGNGGANETGDEVGKEDKDNGDGKPMLCCRVWVGEREVVCVSDGISVLEVETRAAEEAVDLLKAERAGEPGRNPLKRSMSESKM